MNTPKGLEGSWPSALLASLLFVKASFPKICISYDTKRTSRQIMIMSYIQELIYIAMIIFFCEYYDHNI